MKHQSDESSLAKPQVFSEILPPPSLHVA